MPQAKSPSKPKAAAALVLLTSGLVFVNTVAMPQITHFFKIPTFIVDFTVGKVLGLALGKTFGSSTIDALATFITAL